MNLCCTCKTDFASVAAFDVTESGSTPTPLGKDLEPEPPREDGRRCMDQDEMLAEGARPARAESDRRCSGPLRAVPGRPPRCNSAHTCGEATPGAAGPLTFG